MSEKLRVPVEDVARINKELVSHAEEQLEVIGASLRDLASRIKREKPKMLVFLDKSVRPFGIPFMKYLGEKMGEEAPKIRFYNDAHLKQAYLDNDLQELNQIVEDDLEELKGKKVFFIDETYSRGKGAAAIEAASRILGPDMYYFALSIDPTEPTPILHRGEFVITEDQHAPAIARIESNPNFVIYRNPIHNLFSREISRLYVGEYGNGSTYGIWGTPDEESNDGRNASIRDVLMAPEGSNGEEYEKGVRKLSFDTVREIQQKIYETLKVHEE